MTFAAALYLVLERARKVSRAELASILWPDVDAERRGHRLRQTILQLKRLGLTLTVDRNSVSVQGEIATDIADLQGRDLLEVPSLTFLPGYDPTFSASFADWVDRRRAAVHAGITEELTARLSAARAHGDWTATRLLGNKCLEVDSVNETAVLALAEEAVMRGGKREGVAILDKYLEEIGTSNNDIRLPATVLRRRIKESVPEPTPSLSAEPPFLGRETEMEWLLKRLEIAQSGSAVTCVLVGEAGIGKSRLCTEFLKFASLQGVRVQRVGCRPADVDRPLSVFVDLVPALREMPGALGCAEATLVDLKRLTEYDPQPDQTFAPSNASDAFGRIRFAVYDLFDALTEEQCVLIAVDDAQWLDPTSVKMLAGIAQKCRFRKLLFLLS
ncbi:MAG TPA: AAA family ATPase, partial [Gemmatimonadaceae bacterium]|nr:AAA family ATPase [Gemmatimonadaceae bacterium]